jgi:ADP-ribose pyrophosphatase YjhB (NUDIX family)
MLPSSHLILGEDPRQAASRILREQLGLTGQEIDGPMVFSEVSGPMNHWDIEFVFLGERDNAPLHEAWNELKSWTSLGRRSKRLRDLMKIYLLMWASGTLEMTISSRTVS